MAIECPKYEENLVNCVCTSTDCPRKGRCCECVVNHRSNGNFPACLRYQTGVIPTHN